MADRSLRTLIVMALVIAGTVVITAVALSLTWSGMRSWALWLPVATLVLISGNVAVLNVFSLACINES